ncbi:MAG: 1-deoxy-D-xylulose-5-phosphate synthase, partial [Clostridia bacterium]|nr:1-deoxy-D-xylulose-5-phosphate synthase [Clostridia bacterium]
VFDVGISEEYGVTYAAGLAVAGMKPIVCMYSTFLQRAYDQTVVDVCLQNLPVIFLIDRAGLVGSDGVTHQGVFDISYLSHVPNLTLLAPKDADELGVMVDHALKMGRPVAIRYPNGVCPAIETKRAFSDQDLWEESVVSDGDVVVLAVGPRMLSIALEAAKVRPITVVNARSIKPLDEKMLDKYADNKIITLEDNTRIGGFGSLVAEYYHDKGILISLTIMGVEDKFVEHATVASQLTKNGLTADELISTIDRLNKK